MTCGVLVPEGKIAMGKLSQAIAHGATLLQVDGNFDDCLTLARKLAEAYPVELVNSVNPGAHRGAEDRVVRGRRRARRRPRHPLPPGRQRRQHHGLLAGLPRVPSGTTRGRARRARHAAPADVGLPGRRRRADRARATRSTSPRPSPPPSGSATPPRGSRPRRPATSPAAASRPSPTSRSSPPTASCPPSEGIFVEPASAAGVAGLLRPHEAGHVPGRRAHRLHRDRARPQGPAVGAASSADGAEVVPTRVLGRRRTRQRRRSGWTADGRAAAAPGGGHVRARARPGQQRQPRPGLRLDRPRPRALGRAAPRRVTDEPGLRRSRSRARAPARCPRDEQPPRRPLDAHGLGHSSSTTSASRRRAAPASAATRIPHGRGLGSSATAIVTGIVAAQGLIDAAEATRGLRPRLRQRPRRRSRVTPTTPSASVYGGMTLSWRDDPGETSQAATTTLRVPLHPDVVPVVLVPAEPALDGQGPLGPADPRPARPTPRIQLSARGAARAGAAAPTRATCSRPRRTGCTRRRGAGPTPRSMDARRRGCGARGTPR